MKKIICVLTVFLILLSACGLENEIKEPEISDITVKEDEPETKEPLSTENGGLSTGTKPEESEGEDLSTQVKDEWPKEDDEPGIFDMDAIYTEFYDSEPVKFSKKQLELIAKLAQTEKWVSVPEDWEGKGCVDKPSNILAGKNRAGTIYISPEDGKTLIMVKWGKDQMYKKYYHAPEEVAYDIEIFRAKYAESEITYDSWEDVPQNFPHWDRGLSYFGSGLNEEYDEEKYISETPFFAMLFDHAESLEKEAGRPIDTETYPVYSAEFIEELLGKYYLFSAEELREMAGKHYDPIEGTYNVLGGYGGAYPMLRVYDYKDNGETFDFYVDIYSSVDGYYLMKSSILTVLPNGDGSRKYISNKICFERNYGEDN